MNHRRQSHVHTDPGRCSQRPRRTAAWKLIFLLYGFLPSLIGSPSNTRTGSPTAYHNTQDEIFSHICVKRPPSPPVLERSFFPPAPVVGCQTPAFDSLTPGNTGSVWICASLGTHISSVPLADTYTPVYLAPPGSINRAGPDYPPTERHYKITSNRPAAPDGLGRHRGDTQ